MIKDNYIGMTFPLPQYDYCEKEKYVLYGTGEVARSYYTQLVEKISVNSIVFFIDSMSKERELFDKKIRHSGLLLLYKSSYLSLIENRKSSNLEQT